MVEFAHPLEVVLSACPAPLAIAVHLITSHMRSTVWFVMTALRQKPSIWHGDLLVVRARRAEVSPLASTNCIMTTKVVAS